MATEREIYFTNLVAAYTARMQAPVYPRGWDEEVFPPEEATYKQMRELLSYLVFPYDNDFQSGNWDQDIVCVLNGSKPLAVTENDYYPPFPGIETDDDLERLDLDLRYVATLHGDLKALPLDKGGDDPTVIWYKEANWPRAIYYKSMFENATGWDKFTSSILLGYTYYSTLIYGIPHTNYETRNRIIKALKQSSKVRAMFIRDERANLDLPIRDWEQIDERFGLYLYSHGREAMRALSSKEVSQIYNEWYTSFAEIAMDPNHSYATYQQQKQELEGKLEAIRANPLFQAYARSDSIESLLRQEALRIVQ